MSCDKCSNSAKKILDDMADHRWDDVVKLTNSACRLRTITIAALVAVTVLLCVCVFLISKTTDQEKQIHSLRVDLDAVHDILDAGVETPAAMQAVWDWEHGKMVDHVSRVKMLLEMYRK